MKDRSEADCTLEMPSNLWAPASGGKHGGTFGTHHESFSHCRPCHLCLPIIVSNLLLIYLWHIWSGNPPFEYEYFWTKIITFLTSGKRRVWCAARDFNLVLPLQLEAPDGIHEIHQAVGQGSSKKGIGGPIMRDGGRIKQKALGSYGLASIHRPRLWMDPRAYSWLTNLLLLSAPVLIDPPTGWETATNISNRHLIVWIGEGEALKMWGVRAG